MTDDRPQDVRQTTPGSVEEALRRSMIATLGVISRCGSTFCADRAMRLYLAAFPLDARVRVKLLEDLSYRFLVEAEHDLRVDAIYRFVTKRAHEMTGYGETFRTPAE